MTDHASIYQKFRSNFSFLRRSSDGGLQVPTSIAPAKSRRCSNNEAGVGLSPPAAVNTVHNSAVPSKDASASESEQQSRRHSEADPGPLGLNVVYSPVNGDYRADIVFVHGLGGSSRLTWSKHRNPDLFWPLEFLPLEPDVGQARILSFGYNATFSKRGRVSVSISDFANDLLFDLKYAKDQEGRDLEIGNVPLIFVVHSMGGLIAKEAYIQGQNDPEYQSIIMSVSAITFLATPHRGTKMAALLNRILMSTLFSNPKQYISDLNQNSIALQKLNDQFRRIAPRLDIVSFYETRPTPLVLKNAAVMILEKETSVLGYPGETFKALDADHHNVCKYESPEDPNYIIVRNVLKSLVSKILTSPPPSTTQLLSNRRQSRELKCLLAVADLPDVDYIFFRDQWAEQTGNWILQDHTFVKWFLPAENSNETRILWLNGGPGTGKSVLSSFIIDEGVQRGFSCQYFFVRSGDQKKRSLSTLLRSIAYQLAKSMPEFLERTFDATEEGIDFENADARTVWERVFKDVLFHLPTPSKPNYWIIDGVDEAINPRAVIKQFSDICLMSKNLRILLVGRRTSEIATTFSRIPPALNPVSISIEGHVEDLRHYVQQELNMPAPVEYQQAVMEQVIDRSQNNFLWVSLAVEKLNLCHTQADVDDALQNLPIGMEALYDRMAQSIAQHQNAADKGLATAILQCISTSLRILTLPELFQALDTDTSKILDLQQTVVDLCAGFAVVDNSGNVSMIHQTAREYLLSNDIERPFRVSSDLSHGHMFLNCMRTLMATGLRLKIQTQQLPDFLDYAAIYWSKHLAAMPHNFEPAIEALNKFLTGQSILAWIHYLSATNQLSILVQAARHLSIHFLGQREFQPTLNEQTGSQLLKQSILEGWSVDLIKVVGKFGTILRRNPDSIYRLIPPFCPQNSSMYQIFGTKETRTIQVSGLSSSTWDDSVARISLGTGSFATSITVSGGHIAILASSRTTMSVFLYDSSTFEELSASPITHGERIQKMELNSTGSILATYGYRTTKIWDVASGECRFAVENFQTGQRPLTMLLANNNTQLLVGTDDRCLRSLDLKEDCPSWQMVAELEELELEGHYLNAASFMALNREGSLIAVAYRGHPLSAWEADGPRLLGHCWRTREEVTFGQVIDAVWNPHSPEVFGLYYEGILFRWRPYEEEREEIPTGASKLAISQDGNLIATGNSRGAVKIFTTADLCLIYQLTSEDFIIGLTFSPDMRRIYDIRSYHCNVWEPNALLKFAEQRGNGVDSNSETGSLHLGSMHSVIRSGRIDSVTVVAASPLGRLYSYGTDKGSILLHDTHAHKVHNIYTAKNNLSIEHLEWSNNGRFLCFSHSGKTVIIMALNFQKGVGEDSEHIPTAEIKVDIPLKMEGDNVLISQLLFDQDASHLAVFSRSAAQVISLSSLTVIRSTSLHPATKYKWIMHPNNANQLMGMTADSIKILDWKLVEHQRYRFELGVALEKPWPPEGELGQNNNSRQTASAELSGSAAPKAAGLDYVVVTQGRKPQLLLQISIRGCSSRRRVFLSFDVSSFPTSPFSPEREDPLSMPPNIVESRLSPSHVFPPDVVEDVALLLGSLSQDRIVYLSRTFALCTFQTSSQSSLTGIRKQSVPVSMSSQVHARSQSLPATRPGVLRQTSLPENTLPNKTMNEQSTLLAFRGHADRSSATLNSMRSYSTASSTPPRITAVKETSAVKELFFLPGDWISRDCVSLCLLWTREKSLLCPRNGEVAAVRFSALA